MGTRSPAPAAGESGSVPEGATHVAWDRSDPAPSELVDGRVRRRRRRGSRIPSLGPLGGRGVPGRALGLRLDDQRLHRRPTPTARSTPLPLTSRSTPTRTAPGPDVYGAMKVACEQAGDRRRRRGRWWSGRGSSSGRATGRAGSATGPTGSPTAARCSPRLARRPGAGHRRARPRGLAGRLRRGSGTTGVFDGTGPGDAAGRTSWRRSPTGSARRPTALDLGRQDFLAEHDGRALGWVRVTAAVAATAGVRRDDVDRLRAVLRRRAATGGRSPTPPATPWPGCASTPTRPAPAHPRAGGRGARRLARPVAVRQGRFSVLKATLGHRCPVRRGSR